MKVKPYFAIAAALTASTASASPGGMQNFLDKLRNFESGVDPSQSAFYQENLNNPVYNYAIVTEPGRMVRDCSTGRIVTEPSTIDQYFTKLGIRHLYNPATPDDPVMLRNMQYNSLNAWGFVGYQLGEALLIDAGYYSPQTAVVDGKEYDSFYMFVPDSTWIGCKTEALAEIEGSGGNKVYVTDTNRWKGKFVGKNGVNSFSDLVIPDKQELVIRDAMHFNYKTISKQLSDAGMTWAQALAKSWPDVDVNGQPITVHATMSGILAAAHLSGAWGAADLLTKDKIACDEQGTCITKYVYMFGGYDTLFDVPGDSTSHGSSYDEVISAGWGNDTAILGGGHNQLLLNEQPGSTTTVVDFTFGNDLVVLRDWQAQSPLDTMAINQQSDGAHLIIAGQTVILKNISVATIQDNIDKVIVESKIYPLSWNSGKQVVDNFNPKVDRIEGTAGIGFKHLKAYETANSVVIGPQADDGGIYASYELMGLTIKDLTPDMFTNVAGSFDRLGYIVPLGNQNWGWNMTLVVSNFDVSKTVITVPGNQAVPFSSVKWTQNGTDAEMTLLEPFAKGDGKKLILRNTDVATLTAANFSGFTGSYNEVTIDIPVFFEIQAIVIGNGGSISPAPNEGGVISAKGGSAFTINFIPADGFKVKSLTIDGVEYPPALSYTFPALTTNHTVSVIFEPGVTCPSVWNKDAVYNTGDKATYNGSIYESKWWNTNTQPDQGDPWKLIGLCN